MHRLIFCWALLYCSSASAAIDFKRVDADARRIIATGEVPGLAIAVVEQGEVRFIEGYGRVRVDGSEQVGPRTIFRLASVSKTFTSSLVTKLSEQGYFPLDAKLVDFVPGLPFKTRVQIDSLSISDVLSQQTGLPDYALDRTLETGIDLYSVRAQLSKVKPKCAPGACYGYQNIVYDYLSDLTLASTAKFFETEMAAQLFLPLGLNDTSIGLAAWQQSADAAWPHAGRGAAMRAVMPNENYYRIAAAAGINSSVRDMSLWLRAQLGHYPTVLTKPVLSTLHTAEVDTPGELYGPRWRRERLLKAGYGYGFRIMDYAGSALIYHAGAVQGFRAIFGVLPEHDVGVVLLWNCDCALPAGLFPTILDAALELPTEDWLELDKVEASVARARAAAARSKAKARR